MKTLDLVQGSEEWLTARSHYHTSSEAAVVMGVGRITRQQLIRQKATGDSVEYSKWVEDVLFERGHSVEAFARPLAEAFIGEDLYPVTGTDDEGWMLSSFDGLTMDQDIVWECKLWSAEKAVIVAAGKIPEIDYWQCVHHLYVSSADRCLYTLSDGTESGTQHVWLDAADAADDMDNLDSAYSRFDDDLAAYVPEPTTVEVVGREPDQLPALVVEVTGMVKHSNLKAFQEHALDVLRGINRTLNTDEDFANADKTVKWCERVEKALDAKLDDIIGQMATVEEVTRVVKSLQAETRTVRLELSKLVEARKKTIRAEIANEATAAFRAHLDDVNAGLPSWATISAAEITVDFPGAMKGKKTVTSLRDAVAQALATAKIDIGKIAALIHANLSMVNAEEYSDTGHRDLATLIRQPHCQEMVEARIAAHRAEQVRKEQERKAAEEARIEAERLRIRQEEEAKAQREKDAAIEAEKRRLQAEADETARIAREEERRRNTEAMVQGQEAAKTAAPPVQLSTSAPTTTAAKKTRPSDREIIDALTLHFRVHDSVVIGWLLDMDLSAASADLASNF